MILKCSQQNTSERAYVRTRTPTDCDTRGFSCSSAYADGQGPRRAGGQKTAPEPPGRQSSRLTSCTDAAATRGGRLCDPGVSSGRWPKPLGGICERGEGTVSIWLGRRRSWAGRRRSRLPGPQGGASAVARPCRRLPAKGRKSYFAIQRPPRAPRASRHIGDRPWQGAGVALLVAHSCTRSMRASWAVVSCSRQMFSGSPPRCRPTAEWRQA